MAATTTNPDSNQNVADRGDLNQVGSVLRKVKIGTMLSPLKVTVAGLAAAAAVDITAAATLAAATVVGAIAEDVAAAKALPAILAASALRVTAVGTGALGPRVLTDTGGTPGAPGAAGPGIATLSDDGKTITFEGTVTGFVIEYIPRPAVDMTANFAT